MPRPRNNTPRPLKTAPGQFTGHVGRLDSNYRGGDSTKISQAWRDKPSDRFDWDKALTLHALAMQQLGYTLSTQQQQRIDDHEKR